MTVGNIDDAKIRYSKKLNASIRNLIPSLQKCGISVFAMKTALREMETIANNLIIHQDAREGEGVRRQEHDQDENEDAASRGKMTELHKRDINLC